MIAFYFEVSFQYNGSCKWKDGFYCCIIFIQTGSGVPMVQIVKDFQAHFQKPPPNNTVMLAVVEKFHQKGIVLCGRNNVLVVQSR